MCNNLNICEYCGITIQAGTYNYKDTPRKFCSKTCTKLQWKKLNKDKVKLSNVKYCETHKETLSLKKKHWADNNRLYFREYASLRNRKLVQARPIWADLDDIKNVYLEAQYMQLEVDHIIPLKHPLVCGLHVWNNLQLLSRSQNARKSNKYIIE